MGASGKTVDILSGPTTRPSLRKCRSTKVDTARGPKDRRVRLSPETAIQFYDVQDRLGYERATEAIDWLMEKSKDSIDKLFDISSQHYDHFVRAGDSDDLKMSNEGDFEEAVYVQNIPSGSLSDYVNNLSANSYMENSSLFPHLHMIENSCFPSSSCEPSVRIPFSNEVSKSYNSTQRHQYQEEFEGFNQGIFPIHASNNHVASMADI